MARPLRIQYPGAFYHITCRGNGRKDIFLDDKDRAHFLVLLSKSLETYQVILYAYVLMNNHFHVLVQTRRANLSEFMRCFNICYTGWFNYRHQRCGHLYQGRYRALLIDADDYLLVVSRYLHLNSVRVKELRSANYQERWRYARRYRWSSLPGYVDKKKVLDIIDYDLILEIVGGRRAYEVFVLDGVKHDVRNPFADVKHQMILGGDDFVARVKGEYLECGSLREQPAYRQLVVALIDPQVVLDCVIKVCGVDTAIISRPRIRGSGMARGIAAELLYRYSGLTEAEIGRVLGGIDYGGVHQLRRRLRQHIDNDSNIKEHYAKIEHALKKLCSK